MTLVNEKVIEYNRNYLVGNYAFNVPSGFLPGDVTGLQTQIDFSDITTLFTDSAKTTPVTVDTDIIGAAEDLTGNGNDVLQAGADGLKPTYQTLEQNSLSVSQYDGADDFLRATFTLNQPCTYYFVFSQIAWALNRRVIDGAVAQAMVFQSAVTPDLSLQAGAGAAGPLTLATGTFGIIMAVFDGASSSFRLNGGTPATASIGVNNPGGITLGARNTDTNASNVKIGEVLIYDSAISGGDDTNILTYLNDKWAVF